MKQLYFVRHGLSQLGKQGMWAGSTDTPLAPEGREQAKTAGQGAQNLGIDYIVSSPLVRAHDTATIIAEQIGLDPKHIEINDLIVERDFGSLEATIWDPDFDVDSITDIETAESVLERARTAYEHLKTIPVDTVLVVSHGSFGRALRHVIHPDIPFDKTGRFENAKIVQLIPPHNL